MAPRPAVDSETPATPIMLHVAVRAISFGSGRGGLERAAGLHVRLMAESGIPVLLHADDAQVSGDVPPGVELVSVRWPRGPRVSRKAIFGPAYVVWCRRLAKSLLDRSIGNSVWHLHGAAAGALRTAGPSSRPTVVHTHGMEEFGPLSSRTLPTRPFVRHLGRAASAADLLISTDPSLTSKVLEHLSVAASKVRLIPNVVDVDELHELAAKGSALRSAVLTFVSVGRLARNKGYDLWLDALISMNESQDLAPDWEWVHFGSGTELASLATRASEAFGTRVRFVEHADDAMVQATIASANFFVQPSRYEGSSLTTLEAMCQGVPVIGTPVGGIPDKVTDGETGFLAAAPTSAALADAARRAMSSRSLAEIGLAARDWVALNRSSTTITGAYSALYKELTNLHSDSYNV